MPATSPALWTLDPDDPRAPSVEVWERMTEAQRSRVTASLPSEFAATEECLPEGRLHYESVFWTQDSLRTHFDKLGRKIYIGANTAVYYPNERMFSPDVMAVLGVEDDHPRASWSVLEEGKALDVCSVIEH
jgi:hypothetical protein